MQFYWIIVLDIVFGLVYNSIMKRKKHGNAIHKSLFDKDTLFGHKVQRDRSKYKREHNYNIMKKKVNYE
jgi:hypothetical protein